MIDIKIYTDNAAFEDNDDEVDACLKQVAGSFSRGKGSTAFDITDSNGNTCGYAIKIQGQQFNMAWPGKDRITIDGPNIGRVVLPTDQAIELCKRLNDLLDIFAPFTD